MIRNDYVRAKHLRSLLQQDMKRRYTSFFFIFKKLRTLVVCFFLYRSLFLQLWNGASRKIHRSTLVALLPLLAYIVLWYIKDFIEKNKMEEPLFHIVSPNYWMKIHRLHIQ